MKAKDQTKKDLLLKMEGVLGISLTKEKAEDLYHLVIGYVLESAIRFGKWRLPKGLGSFTVRTYKGGRRLHPTTQRYVLVPSKEKLRYTAGSSVTARLEGKVSSLTPS